MTCCQRQMALEAFSAMQPPCKRQSGVRFIAGAPFRKGQDRNLQRIRATSPTGETMRLERIQSEFESPVAYQIARVAQRQRRQFQTLHSGSSNLPARTNASVAKRKRGST